MHQGEGGGGDDHLEGQPGAEDDPGEDVEAEVGRPEEVVEARPGQLGGVEGRLAVGGEERRRQGHHREPAGNGAATISTRLVGWPAASWRASGPAAAGRRGAERSRVPDPRVDPGGDDVDEEADGHHEQGVEGDDALHSRVVAVAAGSRRACRRCPARRTSPRSARPPTGAGRTGDRRRRPPGTSAFLRAWPKTMRRSGRPRARAAST